MFLVNSVCTSNFHAECVGLKEDSFDCMVQERSFTFWLCKSCRSKSLQPDLPADGACGLDDVLSSAECGSLQFIHMPSDQLKKNVETIVQNQCQAHPPPSLESSSTTFFFQ
jgi:hypothetical protein